MSVLIPWTLILNIKFTNVASHIVHIRNCLTWENKKDEIIIYLREATSEQFNM